MKKATNQTVGKRIKDLRKVSNITQKELAKKLFLSRSCIANYESNNRIPDTDTIQRVAELFNVTFNYLMGIQEDDTGISQYLHELEMSKYLTEEGHLDISDLIPAQKIALLEYFLFLLNRE